MTQLARPSLGSTWWETRVRPEHPFDLTTTQTGRMALARVTGAIDVVHSADFQARMQPVCDTAQRVVLDLRRADFIDSEGVRALMVLHDQMEARGAELRLVVQPDSRVRRTLSLLRLQERLHLYDSAMIAWIHSGRETSAGGRRRRDRAGKTE
jgi:anti-anti-sigma factor